MSWPTNPSLDQERWDIPINENLTAIKEAIGDPDAVSGLMDRVDTAETDIAAAESTISGHTTTLGTHTSELASQGGRLTTAEARVDENSTYPARPAAYSDLNLWSAFDASGGSAGSWVSDTYAHWIDGLADYFAPEITDGAVTVEDLGESSATGKNLYAYRAGTGPYEVLIVGGQHGAETLGQWAGMRWFEGFVRSEHPSYAALRRLLSVTWIPTANPYNYNAGRKNGNGVDLNRNYDLLWSRYSETDPSSTSYKGASAVSEPEAQIIEALIDGNDYRVVLDLHNFNSGADEGQLYLPGSWYLGARQLGLDVFRTWSKQYGDGFATSLLTPNHTQPTLHNYANYVARHVNDHADAATAALEMNANAGGSTSTVITETGMTAYCGLIHTYLGLWSAKVGDALSLPFSYQLWAGRSSQSDSTSVADGGSLLATGSSTYQPITFADRRPASGGIAGNTLDIPIHSAPAFVTYHLDATVASLGNASARVEFSFELDGTQETLLVGTCTTTANSGDRASTQVTVWKQFSSVSNTSVTSAKVLVRKITGGDVAIRVVTVTVAVTPTPPGLQPPMLGGA